MYRVSQNTAPPYINQMFKPTNANRHLRSSNDLNYLIPKPTKEIFKGSMS
jgi:hypothetical protein